MASKHDREQQMLDAFFEDGAAPDLSNLPRGVLHINLISAVKERVEKDTGVLWHKVGPEDVRDWASKGFKKAKKGEYQSFSEEDQSRYNYKMLGASLRK